MLVAHNLCRGAHTELYEITLIHTAMYYNQCSDLLIGRPYMHESPVTKHVLFSDLHLSNADLYKYTHGFTGHMVVMFTFQSVQISL
jgi:hypothetical protein